MLLIPRGGTEKAQSCEDIRKKEGDGVQRGIREKERKDINSGEEHETVEKKKIKRTKKKRIRKG
jgi:hypothetical protein